MKVAGGKIRLLWTASVVFQRTVLLWLLCTRSTQNGKYSIGDGHLFGSLSELVNFYRRNMMKDKSGIEVTLTQVHFHCHVLYVSEKLDRLDWTPVRAASSCLWFLQAHCSLCCYFVQLKSPESADIATK